MYWVEALSALFNIGYVVGLIHRKRWAWPSGGLGCLLAVWLFYDQSLYLEALLNVAYTFMAGYGWARWSLPPKALPIFELGGSQRIAWGLGGLIVALPLGWVFHRFTSNPNPFVDASIFIFSVLATYGQAQRCLDTWMAWIGINLAMVGLCFVRDMPIYGVYSAGMAIMAWKGWKSWSRDLRS